jgi:hypothetical protein
MKLQSIQVAKTTWLMDVGETNPRGKNIFTDFVPAMVSEFHFKTVPQEGGDFKDGMKFSLGTFITSAGDAIQVAFALYSDGVAADTYSSTDASEEFLNEVARLFIEMGYVFDPSMIRKKIYLSQLFLSCDKPLTGLNPKLIDFAKRISETTGLGIPYATSAIEFWPDQSRVFKPANFGLQKRAGDDPEDNRYWSQAPLQTRDHLKLLDELEAILA